MTTTIPKGWKKLKTHHDFTEYEYTKNGLRALVATRASTPTIGTMVTYLVGSRFEGLGTTGYTHILEHMMFKGSKKYPTSKDGMWRMHAEGALLNATTWTDRTNYFVIANKDKVDEILDIESDRMRNLLLDPKELAAEMQVVWNEYERGENNPREALDKGVWATAFMGHGYHHSTIGWRADIEGVTAEKLREFYDTYYWPNNAVVTMVGDISHKDALAKITKYFGKIPASPHSIPTPIAREPKQEGQRRITISRAGGSPHFHIGYKSVAALHADVPAIMVLLHILGESSGSLLDTAFTDTGIVESINAGQVWWHDPSLIEISATLTNARTPEEFEKQFMEYIASVPERITKELVALSKDSLKAGAVWNQDGQLNTLMSLNEGIASGDWTFYVDMERRVAAVTLAQVRKAAQTYLRPDQATIGWYIPK